MKKRTVGILVAAICVAVAGASFAAGWFTNNKSEQNTVTIGEPITISVSGSVAGNTVLMPGASVETVFTVAGLESGMNYKLVINNVAFKQDEDDRISSIGVWSYDVKTTGDYSGAPTALAATGGDLLASAANGTVTVKLILAGEGSVDADTLKSAVLTFDVALVAA
jgi:hypothetical protein